MLGPIRYIGFGGGDLRNYWSADFTPEVIDAVQLDDQARLDQAFRYHNVFRQLTTEVAVFGGVDALLAEDVESTSELTSPAIGQVHQLLSVSLESLSGVSQPSLSSSSLTITDVNTTESWNDGQTGIVITGSGFVS